MAEKFKLEETSAGTKWWDQAINRNNKKVEAVINTIIDNDSSSGVANAELALKVTELESSLETVNSELNENKQDINNIKLFNKECFITKNHAIEDNVFLRLFNKRFNKDLKLITTDVDMSYDFNASQDGNPFKFRCDTPSYESDIEIDGDIKMNNNSDGVSQYQLEIDRFDPYKTYSVGVENINTVAYGVRVGLLFSCYKNGQFIFLRKNTAGKLDICEEKTIDSVNTGVTIVDTIDYTNNILLIVTVVKNKFEIYIKNNRNIKYISTIKRDDMTDNLDKNIILEKKYSVALWTRIGAGENITINLIQSYFDIGISQADIRPIKYEDGSPLIENGRIFFSISARTQDDNYQAIISWKHPFCDIRLEGVLFFNYGDDTKIYNDIASSITYNRQTGEWIIWNAGMNKNHILSRKILNYDPRFGINIIQSDLMSIEKTDSDGKPTVTLDESFYGKFGDEDPDILYDKNNGKWYLAICRLYNNKYRYYLFESDNPINNFVYKSKTTSGTNTGGNLVKYGGDILLVCGDNDNGILYKAFNINNLEEYKTLSFDFKDGGYRGWGTLIPVPTGNNCKYYFVTFDRQKFGTGNWSYGSLYFYESKLQNNGYEGNIKYNL